MILKDAEDKLKELREEKWRQVAEELQAEDHHQYLRAYTAGEVEGGHTTDLRNMRGGSLHRST